MRKRLISSFFFSFDLTKPKKINPNFRREYGAKVLGFDLSKNMVDIAQERLAKHGLDDIVFEIKDATLIDYPEGTFDVIYSR